MQYVKQNKACISLKKSVLAWRDSFRTFAWEKAFPDPVIAINQTRQLLALA
jgi:hypothetical protein